VSYLLFLKKKHGQCDFVGATAHREDFVGGISDRSLFFQI